MNQQYPTFSRRAGLTAGLAILSGVSLTSFAAPAAAKNSKHTGAGSAPGIGDVAFAGVSAATMWVKPGIARPDVDAPSLTNPTDLHQWNKNMTVVENRKWLVGNLESQVLYGTRVIVDEIQGEWAKIVVPQQPTPRDERGYPGWVPLVQLVKNNTYAELLAAKPIATVRATFATISANPAGKKPILEVSFNTQLPVLGETGKSVRVALPEGGTGYLPKSAVYVLAPGKKLPPATVEDVIATGERFLGLKYLWAGMGAYGFDCSGFTYSIFRHHGIDIPRDAGPQMKHSGLPLVQRADLKRGDLVFFATKPGGESIRHVAVYLGDDLIMHSPNSARSVEIMTLTEYDPQGDYAGAVRVIN